MPMYNQRESKGPVTLDIYKVLGTNYIFVVCSETLSREIQMSLCTPRIKTAITILHI